MGQRRGRERFTAGSELDMGTPGKDRWRRRIGAAVMVAVTAVSLTVAFGTSASASPSPAPTTTTQLITVNSPAAGSSYATLSAWQRGPAGVWVRKFGPVDARVGGAGIGHASEGSELTPAGTFPLTVAFGRLANPGTKMSYFQTDTLDWWDENPSSPTYNLHVRRLSSPGGASENLFYSGTAYNYGVNIGYNLARVPGAGSAFFLHVGTGSSTAGCVSIAQGTLQGILRWLDPAQHPYINIRVGAPLVPTAPMTSAQSIKAVSALYQGILHEPAGTGSTVYRDQLLRGVSMRSVATTLANSGGALNRTVTLVYLQCLGRAPDRAGLAVNTAWLHRGGTRQGLYVRICASGEAWVHANGQPHTWLNTLYKGILRRPLDPSAAPWRAVLAQSGRQVVVSRIAGSGESAARALDQIYLAMLGRPANRTELGSQAALMAGRGIFTVPPAVAATAEFWRRAQR